MTRCQTPGWERPVWCLLPAQHARRQLWSAQQDKLLLGLAGELEPEAAAVLMLVPAHADSASEGSAASADAGVHSCCCCCNCASAAAASSAAHSVRAACSSCCSSGCEALPCSSSTEPLSTEYTLGGSSSCSLHTQKHAKQAQGLQHRLAHKVGACASLLHVMRHGLPRTLTAPPLPAAPAALRVQRCRPGHPRRSPQTAAGPGPAAGQGPTHPDHACVLVCQTRPASVAAGAAGTWSSG